MRYSLVVPALNEEGAIASTLRRALATRAKVIDRTPVREMTIVFVNDGSTDRTQEIVDSPEFDEVVKVRFERNQGYGAAIKAGWRATDADLLGFIDADGTCNPDDSVDLINRLLETHADVVLAARMNPESQMPRIRKLGNFLFAKLLGIVSGKKLTDCASGYRVVRRSSLELISPLPSGLHFTPAMSAICLLDPRLRIEEVPTSYSERIGRSKLSVIKDGFRFLFVILFTVCCYTPIRTMLTVSAFWLALTGAGLGLLQLLKVPMSPSLLAMGSGLVAATVIWTGVVCHQLNWLLIGPRRSVGWDERLLQSLIGFKTLITCGLAVMAASIAGLLISTAIPSLGQEVALPMVFFLTQGATAALMGIILRVVWAVGEKQKAMLGKEYCCEHDHRLARPVATESISADPRECEALSTANSPIHAV
jgi:glycosyltransferase involved in cell wall biosynthesis